MAGLLLKEWYTLSRQVWMYLVAILIFTVIPGLNAVMLAIVYSAMLPMTAISYDERSKWDSLAVTMPYSPMSMVFSKYLISYIGLIATLLVSMTVETLFSLIIGSGPEEGQAISLAMAAASILLLQGITIPILFKFGVEKGRYIFIVVYMLFFLVGTRLSGSIEGVFQGSHLPAVLFIAAAAVNIASVFISTAIYKRKQF